MLFDDWWMPAPSWARPTRYWRYLLAWVALCAAVLAVMWVYGWIGSSSALGPGWYCLLVVDEANPGGLVGVPPDDALVPDFLISPTSATLALPPGVDSPDQATKIYVLHTASFGFPQPAGGRSPAGGQPPAPGPTLPETIAGVRAYAVHGFSLVTLPGTAALVQPVSLPGRMAGPESQSLVSSSNIIDNGVRRVRSLTALALYRDGRALLRYGAQLFALRVGETWVREEQPAGVGFAAREAPVIMITIHNYGFFRVSAAGPGSRAPPAPAWRPRRAV